MALPIAARAADNPPIRVACVGDSITYGAGTTDRAKNAYPAQLGAILGKGWDVRNFGVSGRTLLKKGDHPWTAEKAYPDTLAFQPDIIVILLGTNDTKAWNWKFADEFTADYRDLIARFQALPTRPTLYLCHPIPVGGADTYGITEAGVEEEIPLIDAVAVETHSRLIDLYGALKDHVDLLPDKVHPNNAGAALMAQAVAAALTGGAAAAAH